MGKRVTKIPATKARYQKSEDQTARKRRAAGYARVSSDHEEQQSSYEAQLDYYTNYIKRHADWEFAGMYSDEGVTGTSTKHRKGFNQMVSDALNGKIDLIITKSVSRFARNTVDSLTTVRKLKEKGIEIYFEKENIWTLDAKGELLITIMSSLAQEESRSISENTTWGRRKQFADGHASVNFKRFLGYDRGENGEFVVNEKQAGTVREIYRLFLSGLSFGAVAKELEKQGRAAPAGGKKWYPESVESILTNEKYKGDALLQKCYTADFLTKKQVKNNGEVPQYYVEGHHQGIVTPEQYEEVQREIERRKGCGRRYSGVSIFSSKIICGECGGFFGSKVWHSTDKYRKVVWRCNRKYGDGCKCQTPHLVEEEVKILFLRALAVLWKDKDVYIANMEVLRDDVAATDGLKEELDAAVAEMETLAELVRRAVMENAVTALDQREYEERYTKLVEMNEAKCAEAESLKARLNEAKATEEAIEAFIEKLRGMDGVRECFDEDLWSGMVESVTVYVDRSVRLRFKGGIEIQVDEGKEGR